MIFSSFVIATTLVTVPLLLLLCVGSMGVALQQLAGNKIVAALVCYGFAICIGTGAVYLIALSFRNISAWAILTH